MENVKVSIVLKNKGSLIANATLSFNTTGFGFITVKGFQIWKSKVFNSRLQEAINIAPPSRLAFGRYVPLVFIEEPNSWQALEDIIYSEYCKIKQPFDEDINPGDLPDSLLTVTTK